MKVPNSLVCSPACARAQVKYRTARQFSGAALAAAARTGSSAADRAYQAALLDPAAAPGGVHPMMRLIADAAPQAGEAAMRSGREPEVRCLKTSI